MSRRFSSHDVRQLRSPCSWRTFSFICIGSVEKVWDRKCEDEWNLLGEGALYDGYYTEWWLWLVLSVVIVLGMLSNQGVTKRCRLSLLTNSALAIRVQMRGEGGELRGLSQWVQLCITWHGAQVNFGDLLPYLTYASSQLYSSNVFD